MLKKQTVATICLCLVGLLGNFLHTPLFFEVDFLFGEIAIFLALLRVGPVSGAIVAGISGTYTIVLWDHPYYIVISVLQAIFVGLAYPRFRQNLLAAVGTYWLIIGAPLVWVFYREIMNVSESGTVLVLLKQTVNSVCNAIIAGFFHALIPAFSLRSVTARIKLNQILFYLFVGAAILPALILMVTNSRQQVVNLESRMRSEIDNISESIANSLSLWINHQVEGVESLARLTAEVGIRRDPSRLQQMLQQQIKSFPAFHNMYIADAAGTTVGFYPPFNAEGQSTIGISFADRPYYKLISSGENLVISEVFAGRGGISAPITVIASRVGRKAFEGFVLGALKLERLNHILSRDIADHDIRAVVVDFNQMVVASNSSSIRPMSDLPSDNLVHIERTADGYYKRLPHSDDLPVMAQWSRSVNGRSIDLPNVRWRLIVEKPMAGYIAALERQYAQGFAIVLAVAIGGFLLAALVTRWLVAPISRLARLTSNSPEELLHTPVVAFPSSPIFEIRTLSNNFRSMNLALQDYFRTLVQSSKKLEEKNSELETEVKKKELAQQSALEAQRTAEEANRTKSQFLANMSHEIRTPLGVILGYVELLKSQTPEHTEEGVYLETIQRNGLQLSELIDDILDLSKVEAGKVDIRPQEVWLRNIVQYGIFSFENRAAAKQIAIEVSSDGPIPTKILADPVRVTQIIMNLVSNAVKFTEEGKVSVTISSKCDGNGEQYIYFAIEDSGIGMSPDEQQRLFQPFSQADASTTKKYGGTGLGLVLARKLAQLLGGNVELQDSRPGSGSTFVAYFKIGKITQNQFVDTIEQILHPEKGLKQSDAEKKELEGYTILLAEDGPEIRQLIGTFLRGAGAKVEEAENGVEAYEAALKQGPDAIIMDLQMPYLDGIEATKRLRQAGFHQPIVALTAHALRFYRDKCVEAGCNDYLTKPVNRETLISAITRQLNQEGT